MVYLGLVQRLGRAVTDLMDLRPVYAFEKLTWQIRHIINLQKPAIAQMVPHEFTHSLLYFLFVSLLALGKMMICIVSGACPGRWWCIIPYRCDPYIPDCQFPRCIL